MLCFDLIILFLFFFLFLQFNVNFLIKVLINSKAFLKDCQSWDNWYHWYCGNNNFWYLWWILLTKIWNMKNRDWIILSFLPMMKLNKYFVVYVFLLIYGIIWLLNHQVNALSKDYVGVQTGRIFLKKKKAIIEEDQFWFKLIRLKTKTEHCLIMINKYI